MFTRHVFAVALCLACAFSVAAQDTHATERTRTEASNHFRLGVELFQEGDFRGALMEFQRAYDTAPDARLLYNIGQAKLALQDYVGAMHSYERYLASSTVQPERRAQVEQAIVAMRERTARVRVTVSRDGAEVTMDDVKLGTSPMKTPVLVNVGRHVFSARAPDGATAREAIEVVGGDVRDLKLELVAPVDPSLATAPVERGWAGGRRAAISGWSIGGALLLSGMVTGIMAHRAESDLDDLLDQPEPSHNAIADQKNSANTLSITTDVLLGAGALVAVAGTVAWLYRQRDADVEPEVSALRWDVGVGSLRVAHDF